jgi:hypothetical protein
MFGFATSNRESKEEAYELKDKALCYALSQGWIEPVAKVGDFTVYRGGGYCFHSLIEPLDKADLPADDREILVEAKPREASEMKLKDAMASLNALPEVGLPTGFTDAPNRGRVQLSRRSSPSSFP